MTREDCMWVAYRCTGLLLIVAAIIFTPQLVTAITLYSSAETMALGGEFAGISAQIQTSVKTALIQAILQVAIPGTAGFLFLFGFHWGGGERARATADRILRGEM